MLMALITRSVCSGVAGAEEPWGAGRGRRSSQSGCQQVEAACRARHPAEAAVFSSCFISQQHLNGRSAKKQVLIYARSEQNRK